MFRVPVLECAIMGASEVQASILIMVKNSFFAPFLADWCVRVKFKLHIGD